MLLGRRNPYTGTRLIEDPVLALTVGFNEQEFAFIREFDRKLVAPAWRKFLRERYKTIGALKQAWGKKAAASERWRGGSPRRLYVQTVPGGPAGSAGLVCVCWKTAIPMCVCSREPA